MLTIEYLLRLAAFLLLLVAAAGVPARINITALGLALWVLSTLV